MLLAGQLDCQGGAPRFHFMLPKALLPWGARKADWETEPESGLPVSLVPGKFLEDGDF